MPFEPSFKKRVEKVMEESGTGDGTTGSSDTVGTYAVQLYSDLYNIPDADRIEGVIYMVINDPNMEDSAFKWDAQWDNPDGTHGDFRPLDEVTDMGEF